MTVDRIGSALPTGSITPFAGATAPDGWLVCDGTAYLQSDYAKLYAILSTTYGGVALPGAITAQSPTIYWTLDDTSGTTATDSSGNSNNGTYEGTPTLAQAGAVTSVTGNSVSFNGSSQRVQVTTPTALRVNTSVSMECWANLSSTSLSGYFLYNGRKSNNGFGVGVGSSGSSGVVTATGNQLIVDFDTRTIPTGYNIGTGWHHIAVVINSSGKPSVYADGVLVYSDTGTNMTAPTSTSKTTVACQEDETTPTYRRHFNGKIDEAAFFPSALTQTQIINHMQAGPSGSYFRVPDLSARSALGKSSSTSLGHLGKGASGSDSTTSSVESATHSHGMNSHTHTYSFTATTFGTATGGPVPSSTSGIITNHQHDLIHTHTTPDLVTNYIIKT